MFSGYKICIITLVSEIGVYYERTFNHTLPYAQIVINDYSAYYQISRWNFNDIDFNYNYLIRIIRAKDVDFSGNTFYYSEISEKIQPHLHLNLMVHLGL